MSELELIATRKSKAQDWQKQFGASAFAGGVTEGQTISSMASVRQACQAANTEGDRYDHDQLQLIKKEFTIAGRIIFRRSIGGVTFLRLRDATGELQAYCDQAHMEDTYSDLDFLDVGDIVQVDGRVMATIKGELSVKTERSGLRLLTKAYRPLPTKTAFKDVEQRYRQRYVDLIANPNVMKVFRTRSKIISSLRSYLENLDFVEVETPTMQVLAGGAAARPFTTHHNALDMDLFMRIAPELYLKRLVVGGFDRVFEIGRNYRNEGVSARHNPEFTMLEFYQAYASLPQIMNLTQSMICQVDDQIDPSFKKDRSFSLKDGWPDITMNTAVTVGLINAGGLPCEIITEIAGDSPDIKSWSKLSTREIDWSGYRKAAKGLTEPGALLYLAFEFLAEPFLTQDYRSQDDKSLPVFITDYPVEVSPLARRKDGASELTDRFELFIDGKEIANAFQELTDPEDQAARFQQQALQKANGNEEAMSVDDDYLRALEYGLPPTTGFGMGVDRLCLILMGQASIRDVILFPLMRSNS